MFCLESDSDSESSSEILQADVTLPGVSNAGITQADLVVEADIPVQSGLSSTQVSADISATLPAITDGRYKTEQGFQFNLSERFL